MLVGRQEYGIIEAARRALSQRDLIMVKAIEVQRSACNSRCVRSCWWALED